jgi:hypothetical protein
MASRHGVKAWRQDMAWRTKGKEIVAAPHQIAPAPSAGENVIALSL